MKKTDNLLLSTIMLASFVLPSQVSAQTADEAKETALSFMTQKRGGAVNLSTVNIGKSIAKVKAEQPPTMVVCMPSTLRRVATVWCVPATATRWWRAIQTRVLSTQPTCLTP